MIIKVGDPIQLNLQLEDGVSTKFPRAILRNQFGVLLAQSPVDLTHTGDGLYQNDSVLMPDTQEVTATFKVYDDAGHTILSSAYTIELDVFTKNQATAVAPSFGQGLPGDIVGILDDTGLIKAALEDSGTLSGEVVDEEVLVGYIDEEEITGIWHDNDEVAGSVMVCH